MKKILGIVVLGLILTSNAYAKSVVSKKLLCKTVKNNLKFERGLYFVNSKTVIEYSEPLYYAGMPIEKYKTYHEKYKYRTSLEYIFIWRKGQETVFDLHRSTLNYSRFGKEYECALVNKGFNFDSYFQEKIDLYIKNIKSNRKL
tara:strand:- start:685 stop:1116 length:432 start_codon:yes stop_codon:yes gene_type:complete